MSDQITVDPTAYWKLKYLLCEASAYQQAASRQMDTLNAKVQDAMKAAGLNPDVNYSLDDATYAATQQSTPS